MIVIVVASIQSLINVGNTMMEDVVTLVVGRGRDEFVVGTVKFLYRSESYILLSTHALLVDGQPQHT